MMPLSTAIERRDLRLDEADAAADFFHRCWRPNHVFYSNRDLLLWQFYRNPYAQRFSAGLTFRVALQQNQMVGAMGYIPFAFNRFGTRGYGFHLTNWWVHPEWRRASIGTGLLDDVRRGMSMDACLSGINTDFSESMYEKRPWVVQYNIPRVVLVLDQDRFAEFLASSSDSPWAGLRPIFVRGTEVHSPVASRQCEVTNLPRIRALETTGWDQYYWDRLAPASMGPARETEYLRWRYHEIPVFRYESLVAWQAGEPIGLLVFRVERVGDADASVVRIVDLIADDSAVAMLIDAAVEEAKSRNAVMIDYFSTNSRYFTNFSLCGFMNASDGSAPQYGVPFLFQPLDHARRRLNCAWWVRDMDMRSADALTKFVATKGDNEFDRPNESARSAPRES